MNVKSTVGLGQEKKKRIGRIFPRRKKGAKPNKPARALEENVSLKKEIQDMEFMKGYNEKILRLIIKGNEKLIERYLTLSSENASEIKQSIDEFKMNLANMNEGLQQMTVAVADLSESTSKQNDFCQKILDDIQTVSGNSQSSFSDIRSLNTRINSLRDNSSTLVGLAEHIEDVADRLRYLSLNGKIQAAYLTQFEKKLRKERQDSVAGFSVVAEQMENLSRGVTALVDEQYGSTTHIVDNIMETVKLSTQVENVQTENLSSVKDVTGLIGRLHEELGSVAASSQELSATSEEFASSIEQLYATLENISVNITSFYNSMQKEVGLYRKTRRIADEIKRTADDSGSFREASQRIMALVRGEFVNPATGDSSVPLARLFATIPYKYLPAEYREKFFKEGVTDDSMYLCLMGSTGENPDWNDIRLSKKRQAVLLPQKEQDFALMPMLARNFGKMGIRYDEIVHPVSGGERFVVEDYSLEKNVAGSPYIPDQNFVKEYNLISQIGIGGVFPSGGIFTVFLFFNEPVDEGFAETFMIIPPALQIALQKFDLERKYW